MNQKKKIIIIITIIIAIIIISGVIFWLYYSGKIGKSSLEGGNSKIAKLYTELKEKQEYSFTTTLNNENKIFYAKKDNIAYTKTIYQGNESKYIIKDGNSYLIKDQEKVYYTYYNNESDLEKIALQLSEIKENKYTEGKEKIEGKPYNYEEYEIATDFLMKDIEYEKLEKAKTRFYFSGNKLIYIKTIVEEYQEILNLYISNKKEEKLFEIPTNYKEM